MEYVPGLLKHTFVVLSIKFKIFSSGPSIKICGAAMLLLLVKLKSIQEPSQISFLFTVSVILGFLTTITVTEHVTMQFPDPISA
ncbi:MAG: hypothetical protein HOP11_00610 [Saprospiraceae bacterium]|nr:hypothetical protein [Saprospiraceae bacterium]